MANIIPRELLESDLGVGKVYRAKDPFHIDSPAQFGLFDDRLIVNISETHIQYDSLNVSNGENLPSILTADFLEWASYELAGHSQQFELGS